MLNTLLLIGASCWAQVDAKTPPPPDLKIQAAPLIKQLDDTAQAKRDAAEKALIELGPDVLPLLPAITSRTPAEVKERLGRIRTTLESVISDATSKPSTVTYTGELSLPDAFKELEKQTSNRVVGFDRRANTKIKMAFDKTPYWQALDEVLDQAGLSINAFGGEANALVLMARPEGEGQRAGKGVYSGVFRFEPLRVEARRDLRNDSANGMRIAMSITWEPRITPISLRQPIEKVVAVDDQGKPLEIGRSDSQTVLNASSELGMSAIELGIPLQLAQRTVTKVSSLKGTLTALVPGRLESFEFSGLDTIRDSEQQRAGVTVVFERLRKTDELYEARLRIQYTAGSNALESHRNWIYANPAYMVNDKGERIENLGSNEGSRDENEIGINLMFDLPNGPKGCKLIYQTPATLLQLPVDYEVKEIPLP